MSSSLLQSLTLHLKIPLILNHWRLTLQLIMQDDLVFKLASSIRYPWISRMDRTIYDKHPQLDPVKLLRKCLVASIAGYWLAKLKRWNRYYGSFFAMFPLIAKFLFDEWNLSKTLQPHGIINFNATPKFQFRQQTEAQIERVKAESVRRESRFRNIRVMPTLSGKFLNAKDFIEMLPPTYCN